MLLEIVIFSTRNSTINNSVSFHNFLMNVDKLFGVFSCNFV